MYILTNMFPNSMNSWFKLSHFRRAFSCFSSPRQSLLIALKSRREQVNPSPLKGILVYELADAGRGDAEGLDVDGALLVDGQHVLQRVHLLAHRRARVAPVPPGVLAAAP